MSFNYSCPILHHHHTLLFIFLRQIHVSKAAVRANTTRVCRRISGELFNAMWVSH